MLIRSIIYAWLYLLRAPARRLRSCTSAAPSRCRHQLASLRGRPTSRPHQPARRGGFWDSFITTFTVTTRASHTSSPVGARCLRTPGPSTPRRPPAAACSSGRSRGFTGTSSGGTGRNGRPGQILIVSCSTDLLLGPAGGLASRDRIRGARGLINRSMIRDRHGGTPPLYIYIEISLARTYEISEARALSYLERGFVTKM